METRMKAGSRCKVKQNSWKILGQQVGDNLIHDRKPQLDSYQPVIRHDRDESQMLKTRYDRICTAQAATRSSLQALELQYHVFNWKESRKSCLGQESNSRQQVGDDWVSDYAVFLGKDLRILRCIQMTIRSVCNI